MKNFFKNSGFIVLLIVLASLNVVCGQTYGLTGFKPVFDYPQNNLTGVRFKFRVSENNSESLKLIFGFHRLHTPGSNLNYTIETNIYSGIYQDYKHGDCNQWPLSGVYKERISSIRLAIPDYAYHFNQQSTVTTSIISLDTTKFPVQTYIIDGIKDLYKSDAISQFSMNGKLATVTLERGAILTNVSDFNRCKLPLPAKNYREWFLKLRVDEDEYNFKYVIPDEGARYLTTNEAMNFLSEFIHTKGAFTVDLSEFESKTETEPTWKSVTKFVITKNDGDGLQFGVRVIEGDHGFIQISNNRHNDYLPEGREFTLSKQRLPTTIKESEYPKDFELLQNYPNPFNPITQIQFTLPSYKPTKIEVYNSMGQLVKVLVDELMSSGTHILTFDASSLSSGVYMYRLTTPEFTRTKVMTLVK